MTHARSPILTSCVAILLLGCTESAPSPKTPAASKDASDEKPSNPSPEGKAEKAMPTWIVYTLPG